MMMVMMMLSLCQARAQAGGGPSRILPLRQQQPLPPKPSTRPPSSSSSSSSSYPTPSPSSSMPNAKLQSGAAQHKLKKDIHRCHRMSRRPLSRPDLLSQPMGSSAPLSARPPSFSETVRILNRKVKPREVKRGRIILNLKVLDKPGSGGKATTNQRTQAVQQPAVPLRNRVMGKNRRFGEVPYRGLKVPTFPLPPRRTLGNQQQNTDPMPPKPGGLGTTVASGSLAGPARPTLTGTYPTGQGKPKDSAPENQATAGSEQSRSDPPSLAQAQHPSLKASRASRPTSAQSAATVGPEDTQDAAGDSSSSSSSPPSLPSSSSSSSSSDDGVQILDLSLTHNAGRRSSGVDELLRHGRLRCQNDFSSEPHRCGNGGGAGLEDGDPDWHPEMTVRCANVVVTDVTTNLLTVTIKEFCPPPGNTTATSPTTPPPQAILPP